MWGIVPAAGLGSRIQPLAFSKELLPVGSRRDSGGERPRAVSEYLVDRMVQGGATRICFVVAPGKSDIVEYYGAEAGGVPAAYVVEPEPLGLCDAIFRAMPLIAPEEHVLVGLPDTVWFPEHGMRLLPDGGLSFLCFPVPDPERFDAVLSREDGEITEIRVKSRDPGSRWVWGAFKLDGATLRSLHSVWLERDRRDVYVGTLVTAWIAKGGCARAVRAGEAYVDVGTMSGYREAVRLLGEKA
jgi:dTDP-glucose pyrophosphorylase